MLSAVKRAYFHAKANRELFVELPEEDEEYQEGYVGRLALALYGTRDAASLWQECLAEHLLSIGFVRGISNPCVYYNATRQLRALVHGDDYATSGSLQDLEWMRGELEGRFEMKTTMVGHSLAPNVVREGKILNRIVRATSEGWEYECDQRHVEVLIEQLGLEDSKAVATPGVEEALSDIDNDLHAFLGPEQASQFRALAARANYTSVEQTRTTPLKSSAET